MNSRALTVLARNGRTPAVQRRSDLEGLGLEVRVLRLEGTTFANDIRLLARYVQRLGVRDDSPDTVQLGVAIEHRAERHLRQRA